MPIRHLDFFAGDQQWTESENVAALRNMRLGVDGAYWLRRLYYSMPKEDSVMAMGGIPLGLKQAILRDLENFRKLNCELFIVFSGIPQPMRKTPPVDTRPEVRKQAWEKFKRGDTLGAYRMWQSLGSVAQQDLQNAVIEILQQAGVDYMRAPYSATAQLAYMEQSPRSFFNAVFAGNDYLLFDVDRVVTSIDFQRQAFAWINKGRVLRDLQVSNEAFLEICLLSGFDYIATLPALEDRTNGVAFSFQSAIDLWRNYQNGLNAVSACMEHPEVKRLNYLEQFIRTRFIVKHQPVFTEDCRIEPLNVESCPSDLDELFGVRFPCEVYFYLTQGLLSPSILQSLVSGSVYEAPPLDSSDSEIYRTFITSESMCQLRRQSIGLLLQLLHVSFGEHPVTLQCWFKESAANDIMLHSPSSPMQFPASLSSWFVGENEIKNSLEKYSVAGKVSLQFLVKFLVEPQRATRTVRKSSSTTMLTAEQLKFTALGQALQLRGLTEEKGHALTVFGKALQTGMYNKHPRFTLMQMNEWREQHGELIWTVQELVRMDALNDKPLPGSVDLFSKGPAPLLLIIRVCSLLTPYFKGLPWAGPLSRDALAFNGVVKALNRNLRSLCESCAVYALLCGQQQSNIQPRDFIDFSQVALDLPFLKDNNTAFALLFHSLLQSDDGEEKFTFEDRLAKVEAQFSPWILDVRTEIDRGLAFWSDCCAMMRDLCSMKRPEAATLPAHIRTIGIQFVEADNWLRAIIGAN